MNQTAEILLDKAIKDDSIVAYFEYMKLVPDTLEADLFSSALMNGARKLALYMLIAEQVPDPIEVEANLQITDDPAITLGELALTNISVFNMLKSQDYIGFLATSPEIITGYLTLLRDNNPDFNSTMDYILERALGYQDVQMDVAEARQLLASGQQIHESNLFETLSPFL